MHEHVPGWKLCSFCGQQFAANCPTCVAGHYRIHHSSPRDPYRRALREGRVRGNITDMRSANG